MLTEWFPFDGMNSQAIGLLKKPLADLITGIDGRFGNVGNILNFFY